jgi:hypothetical protein
MRTFNVSFIDGKFWLHIGAWGYVDPLSPKDLADDLQKWIHCCQLERSSTLWICRACASGGQGCALFMDKEPDRCITEMRLSDEELQELQDDGHRAPVDWTKGYMSRLPYRILDALRRSCPSADGWYYELGISDAERAVTEGEE